MGDNTTKGNLPKVPLHGITPVASETERNIITGQPLTQNRTNLITGQPVMPTQSPLEADVFAPNNQLFVQYNGLDRSLGDYKEYDVDLYPALDWQTKRAENQPWYEQLGGFLYQSVVGEIIGGTLEGIGYLFELPDWGDIAKGEEAEVGNWLTHIGEALQEHTRDAAPIYQTNPGEFNPSDSGWWFGNGVSVVSTLSLLLPVAGEARALGMAGRALGITSRMAKGMKALGMSSQAINRLGQVGKGVWMATRSRHIENMMESTQTYKSLLDKYSKSHGMEEARKLAAEGAAKVYRDNWAMLAMDIPQYMLLGSKWSGMGGKLAERAVKATGKTWPKHLMKTGGTAFALGSEGFEEAYQFVVAKEAEYMMDVKAGLIDRKDEQYFTERLDKYMDDGELWTSAFFGALGGGIFKSLGPAAKRVSESATEGTINNMANAMGIRSFNRTKDNDQVHTGPSAEQMHSEATNAMMWAKAVREVDALNDPAMSARVREQMNAAMTLDKIKSGKLASHLEFLEEIQSLSDEEKLMEYNQKHPNAQVSAEFVSMVPQLMEQSKRLQAIQSKFQGKIPESLVDKATMAQFKLEEYNKEIANTDALISRKQEEMPILSRLSSPGAMLWQTALETAAAEQSIKTREHLIEKGLLPKAEAKRLRQENKETRKRLKRLEKARKEAEALDRTEEEREEDSKILESIVAASDIVKLTSKKELLRDYMDDAQAQLNEIHNPETQKKHKYTHYKKQIQAATTLEELGKIKDTLSNENISSTELDSAIREQTELIEAEAAKADEIRREEMNRQDLLNARDKLRGQPSIEEAETTGPLENGDHVRTKENTTAAIAANEAVMDSDYNSESVEPTPLPTVGETLGMDSFYLKPESSMLLAWASPAFSKNLDTRSELLADLIEDPQNDIVGRTVEYEIDTDYLNSSNKAQHKAIVEALANDQPITDELVGYMPVRAYILSEEGERIVINNEEIYGFIHEESWINPKNNKPLSDAEKLTLRRVKAQVVHNYLTGKSNLQSKIVEQSTGEPFSEPNAEGNVKYNLRTIIEEGDIKLLASTGGKLMEGVGKPSTTLVSTKGQKALNYMEVQAPNGEAYPLRINVDFISRDNAEHIADIIEDYYKGKSPDSILDTPSFKGISRSKALSMLVYFGKKGKAPVYFEKGTLIYGKHILNEDSFNKGGRDHFVAWLQKNKRYAVELSHLNGSIMPRGTERMTFLGQEYTGKDRYNDFLIDNLWVHTNAYKVKGRLFKPAGVQLSTAMSETTSPTAPETQVNEVDVNNMMSNFLAKSQGTPTEPDTQMSQEDVGKMMDDFLSKSQKNPFDGFDAEESAFRMDYTVGSPYQLADMEAETAWLDDKLPNIDTEIVDGLIRIKDSSSRAFGAFKNGMIVLSNLAEVGTAYHEAFHAVSHLYLSQEERSTLYDEARAKYGDLSDTQAEEQLAEDFRLYVRSEGKMKYPEKSRNFFQKLFDLIKEVFGFKHLNERSRVNEVFDSITSGNYRYAPTTERINKLSDTELYHKIDGLNSLQNKELVDALMFEVVHKSKAFELEDISQITGQYLSKQFLGGVLKGYYNKALNQGNEAMAEIYTIAVMNLDTLRDNLIDRFKQYNLELETQLEAFDENMELPEEERSNELNIKPAFEYSGKDNASGNTKLLLSLLPKLRSNQIREIDGVPVKDYEYSSIGKPRLASLDATWAVIQKGLANITDTVDAKTGAIATKEEKMLAKLNEIALIRPEIGLIADRLNDASYPENKRVQFFNAFSAQKLNFLTTRVKGKNGSFTYKPGKSDTGSFEEQIRDEWLENFNDSMTVLNDNNQRVLDTKKAQALVKAFNDTRENAREAHKRKEAVANEALGFRAMMQAMGVMLSDNAMRHYINSKDGKTTAQKLVNAMNDVNFLFNDRGLSRMIESPANLDINPIKNEAEILTLANHEATFRDDMTESTVFGADNNLYYTYSLNHFLAKRVNELADNPNHIARILRSPYGKNSRWANWAAVPENQGKFRIHTFNNFREEEAGDTGSKYTDLKPTDEHSIRINHALNGVKKGQPSYYSLLTAADKSVWNAISGPEMVQTGTRMNNEGVSFGNPDIIDTFGRYFLDELARMREAWNQVYGENKLSPEELIDNYHTGKRNAFKSQLFPNLSPFEINEEGNVVATNKNPILKELGLYMTSNDFKATWNAETVQNLRPHIADALEQRIREELDYAVETGVIKVDNGSYSNNSIDKTIIKEYTKTGSEHEAVVQAIGDYTINSIIANVETTKLFTGDPAFYKSMDDLKKRVPGIIAPGQDLVLLRDENNQVMQYFNVAVLSDQEIATTLPTPEGDKTVFEIYKQNFKDILGDQVTDSQLNALLAPYKATNIADAQAYITLDRYRNLSRMLGQWNDKFESAYQRLSEGQKIPADVKLFMQPLKGMYFDLTTAESGNHLIPTYLKYSQAVLIPGVVQGTPLEKLMREMETNSIDEVVFKSGIKAGSRGVTDYNNVLEEGAELTLNPIKLENRFWKLQQDLSAKYMKKGEALEGSQIKKHIIANIQPDLDYNGVRGADLLNQIHQVDIALSNLGKEQFFNEMGVEMNDMGEILSIDNEKLYNKLYESFKADNVNDNILDALDKRIPLEAIPQFRKKIQQKLLAMLNKATVKLNMPGGAFIQQSSFGIQAYDSSIGANQDILWLQESQRLLPPRITKEGVKAGQVLVPHSVMKNIPGVEDMTKAEITAYLKARPEVLEAVGYRIPTQKMSSIDALDIVGILPDYLGDTVIVYPEITAKTGSDFDIDKMFIMMPNYKVKDGNLQKVQSGTKGKKALQNLKLELYRKRLLSENSFVEAVSPIDAEWLKNDAEFIRSLRQQTNEAVKNDLSFFTPREQMETKRKFTGGKFGIGQTANQQVDHIIGQAADLHLNEYIGVGHRHPNGGTDLSRIKDESGGTITETISAFLNAYVDIAKDPYIFDLNNNTFTANTVFLLLRAGVDPKWINRFVSQPILVDYAKMTEKLEGRTSEQPIHESGQKKGKFKTAKELVEEMYPVETEVIPFAEDSMPSKGTLQDQITTPNNTTQRQVLEYFEKLQGYAKALNSAVLASKADTNGAGKTLMEAMLAQNKIRKVSDDAIIKNFEKKFDRTMLGAYTDNSVMLAPEVYDGLFFSMTSGFEGMSQIIADDLGQFNLTNLELATEIENAAYSYIISNANALSVATETETHLQGLQALFSGPKSIARYTQLYKNHPESPIRENLLIKMLKPQINPIGKPSFVGSINARKKGTDAQNRLIEAWEELFNHERPNVRNYAANLVKYAFWSSGFKQGGGSFFDLIPMKYFEETGLTEYIKKEMLNVDNVGGADYLMNFRDQFFRHSWDNTKVVPKVSSKAVQRLDKYPTSHAFKINENSSSYIIGGDREGNPVFYRFVRQGYSLYKLKGYRHNKGLREAIYERTYKLGYTEGPHRVVEYSRTFEPVSQSVVSQNNEAVQLPDNIVDFSVIPAVEPYKAKKEAQLQKASLMEEESLYVLNEKVTRLQKAFNARIELDSEMEAVGKVAQSEDGPVVTVNPNKLRSDTVIHEFGHIYIDALGGMEHEFIREGVRQLERSETEKRVKKLYPELDGEAFKKEVLATAIGEEGAKVFKEQERRSKWGQFIDNFFERIRKLFGIKPNVARQLATELLTNNIREGANAGLSDYVQFQKDEQTVKMEENISALEKFKKKAIQRLEAKMRIHARQSEKVDPERREKHLESLNNLHKAISDTDGVASILKFALRAKRDTEAITNRLIGGLRKVHYPKSEQFPFDKAVDLHTLQDMKSYVSTYDIIPEVMMELKRYEILMGKEYQAITEMLQKIRSNRETIEFLYKDIAEATVAQKLANDSTFMEAKFRENTRREWQKANPRRKFKGSRKEWEAKREEFVNGEVARNREKIDKQELAHVKSILSVSPADISFIDSILTDGRALNDRLIQLAVKSLDRQDFLTMTDFNNTFKDAFSVLEDFRKGKQGILKNPEKMYDLLLEKKEDGTNSGFYVSEYKEYEFQKAKREFFEELDSREELADDERKKEIAKWFAENTTTGFKNGEKITIPAPKWRNPQFAELKKDKSAYALYEKLMDINRKADKKLPANYRLGYRLPTVRKSRMERFSTSGIINTIKHELGDALKRREDDTEFGNTGNDKATIDRVKKGFMEVFTNEDGQEAHFVPIFFRGEISDSKDQSYDLLAMAMSNYYMATNYSNKMDVAADMEVIKHLAGTRDVQVRKNGLLKVRKGTDAAVVKKGIESNAYKSLNSLIEDRLYGIREIDAGNILGININKAVKTAMRWSGHNVLIGNYASALANTVQGKVMTFVESGARQYFDKKDVLAADKKYWGDFGANLKDIGLQEHVVKGKTNLLLQKFDVMQDFEGLVNSTLATIRAERMFNLGTLHGFNKMAEHYIQGTLMYSILNNIKVMNKEGKYLTKDGVTDDRTKAMSLDDAYEVKDGKLVLDKRVAKTTRNIESKEFGNEEAFDISLLIQDLNADLNGNYSTRNRSHAQRYVGGQAAFFLRKWVVRGYKRRFRGVSTAGKSFDNLEDHELFYSESSKSYKEGQYTTVLRFLNNFRKAFKEHKFKAATVEYDQLSDLEKANMRRAGHEAGMAMFGMVAATMLAGLAEDEPDEDASKQLYFWAYMTRRMWSELTFYVNPKEALRTMDTPSVALKTISDMMDAVFYLLTSPAERYKSGDNANRIKWQVMFENVSPLIKGMKQFNRDFEDSYNYMLRPGGF